MYPVDEQFEESKIVGVQPSKDGWDIELEDGWHFFVPENSPVAPKEGMAGRFYSKGLGHSVRGLFLDGKEVFYRTEEEDKEKSEIDMYGENAADWLKRWDADKTVWTIEMGGLGPGYEQCIHITMAEILRHTLERKYEADLWDDDEDLFRKVEKEVEEASFSNPVIKSLGLSGAQWGAAFALAIQFYRNGPRSVLADDRVKDRHIQVRRTFP